MYKELRNLNIFADSALVNLYCLETGEESVIVVWIVRNGPQFTIDKNRIYRQSIECDGETQYTFMDSIKNIENNSDFLKWCF